MSADIEDLARRIVLAAHELHQAHAREDEMSAWPSSHGITVGGASGHGQSPTEARGVLGRHTRSADRIERILARAVKLLEDAVTDSLTTRPSKPCSCCRDVLATHGALCWDCLDFRKRRGLNCTPEFHHDLADRPHRHRPCECPPSCCPDGCLDRVPPREGRRVSSRCRQRQYRARLAADAIASAPH